MHVSVQDHATVTAAVTAAEAGTDGEIVTIVARRSDGYHDVALQYALLGLVLTLIVFVAAPDLAHRIEAVFHDPWADRAPRAPFMVALFVPVLVFLAIRLAMGSRPLRMALTPAGTKTRRVRRQALALFRAGAEKRTIARTGVLLYLSLDEHRAELIADSSIHSRVPAETWGAAMAALVAATHDGRPGDGMAAAVHQIGVVLSEHFPRSEGDVNELPDRLIEL